MQQLKGDQQAGIEAQKAAQQSGLQAQGADEQAALQAQQAEATAQQQAAGGAVGRDEPASRGRVMANCPMCGELWNDVRCGVCGWKEPSQPAVTMFVCGGRQAHTCPVTGLPHDMSAIHRFKDGGSIACKDCGVTAMQIDLMEAP